MDKERGWSRPKDWDTVRVLRCRECADTFVNKRRFDKHVASHGSKQIQFYCLKCERSYTRKDNLKVHYNNHHSSSLDDLPKICGETEEEHERGRADAESRQAAKERQQDRPEKRRMSETTKDTGSPQPKKMKEAVEAVTGKEENEDATKGLIPPTPERMETDGVSALSLSPGSMSLVDQCLKQQPPPLEVRSGGKPKGMMSLMHELKSESDSDEEGDLRIVLNKESASDAETEASSQRISLGRVLKGSTLKCQEKKHHISYPATEVARDASSPRPASAKVFRISGEERGARRAVPVSTPDLEMMMAGKVRRVKEVHTTSRFQNGVKVSEEVTERTYEVNFTAGFVLQ